MCGSFWSHLLDALHVTARVHQQDLETDEQCEVEPIGIHVDAGTAQLREYISTIG